MARGDVQALIKRIGEANKALDAGPEVVAHEEPKQLAPVAIKSAPPVKVEALPVVEVKGLVKQLEALAKKEHKPDAKKHKLRQETVSALTRIAAELNAKEALDLSPIIDLLAEIAKQHPVSDNYTFTINRDRNGFMTTVDARVVT